MKINCYNQMSVVNNQMNDKMNCYNQVNVVKHKPKILVYGNINKDLLDEQIKGYYHTKNIIEFRSLVPEYDIIIQVKANICMYKFSLIISKNEDYKLIKDYINLFNEFLYKN